MANYPTITTVSLAKFSGRPAEDYTDFATTAISQAILLFKVSTCLKSWPDDPVSAELAENAVLAMAEAIFSVQPFHKVLSNPFSSETIGSYSYSKLAGVAANGIPTGVSWFDIAVSNLGICDLEDGISEGGGIEVFEYDVKFAPGHRSENVRMLTDHEVMTMRGYGYDPVTRSSI